MKTTVVLSCYNGEKFIIEQLESIRNQTVPPNEVLIGDDCSTDNTFEIVKDYIEKNQLTNWKIERNHQNMGWKRNFASLILKATQDIIFLSDQDDIWYPNKIEIMVDALSKTGDKLIVSDLEVQYMAENVQEYNPEALGKKDGIQHMQLKTKWLRIMRPGCVYAIERKFAQLCFSKYWHENLAHDLFIWQCAYVADSVTYIPSPLMKFRRFAESTTSEKIASKKNFRVIENGIFIESLEAARKISEVPDFASARGKRRADRCLNLEKRRKDFFETRKVSSWLICGMFLECYPYKKSWIADYWYMRCK